MSSPVNPEENVPSGVGTLPRMSMRDNFSQPLTLKCDWCHKTKRCKNNSQVNHFRRVYPKGRTYSDNDGKLVAASGQMLDNTADVYVLCANCVPKVKKYVLLCWYEGEQYKRWLEDFVNVHEVFFDADDNK